MKKLFTLLFTLLLFLTGFAQVKTFDRIKIREKLFIPKPINNNEAVDFGTLKDSLGVKADTSKVALLATQNIFVKDQEISHATLAQFKVTVNTNETSTLSQNAGGGFLDLQSSTGVQTFITSNGASWFKGGDVNIGTVTPQDQNFAFRIRNDADSDGGVFVTDVFQLVLTPNADPTLATWDFTSTQSRGYTFDKPITAATLAGTNMTNAHFQYFFGGRLIDAAMSQESGSMYINIDRGLTVGILTPDDTRPIFSIIGDADIDVPDVNETFALTLTPNADPTLATWDFTSTQSAGYTFDKDVAIDGDLDLTTTATNHLLLPLNDNTTTPTLAFGDGDTGFYQSTDNAISVATDGTGRWLISSTVLGGNGSDEGAIKAGTASSTNSTFIPRRGDPGVGIGWVSTGIGSLVAENFSSMTWSNTGIGVNGTISSSTLTETFFPTVIGGVLANSVMSQSGGDIGITGNLDLSGHLKRSVESGITASTTQSQGQGQLTKDLNKITIIANINDVVTLMPALEGMIIRIMVEVLQSTLQIFPSSGDDLGQGVNNSETLVTGLVVGDSRTYICYEDGIWN